MEITKAIQRVGNNPNNAKTNGQDMLIVEFDILETLEGDDLGPICKVIDVFQRTGRDWKLTDKGKYAIGRAKSLVAAALGVPNEAVTADMLNGFDWDGLTGMRVLAITDSFYDGDYSVTRYEALPAE